MSGNMGETPRRNTSGIMSLNKKKCTCKITATISTFFSLTTEGQSLWSFFILLIYLTGHVNLCRLSLGGAQKWQFGFRPFDHHGHVHHIWPAQPWSCRGLWEGLWLRKWGDEHSWVWSSTTGKRFWSLHHRAVFKWIPWHRQHVRSPFHHD